MKKILLLMCVIGVVVFLLGSVALVAQSDDSIKYWTDDLSFDTSMIYVSDIRYVGTADYKFKTVIIYAETCIVKEADVVIIKCSDGKPLIILE